MAALLTGSLLGSACQRSAAGETVVVQDDFEVASSWEFRARRGTGTQGLSTQSPHGGRGCLESVFSYGSLTASRKLDLPERHARVRFWFRPAFDATRLTDVVLTIAVDSLTDGRCYGVRVRDPAPEEWRLFETDVSRFSTRLLGDRIGAVHVSLSSYSGPLRLALDDFAILQREGEGSPSLEPPLRSPAALAYQPPARCTPRLREALTGRLRAVMADDPRTFGPIAASGANAVVLPARDGSVLDLVGKAHEKDLVALAAFPVFRTDPNQGESARGRTAGLSDSVGANVVCPFDWANWENVVQARLRRLASLAAKIPLDGILLDLHLYDSIPASLADAECCLCAHCFDTYVRAKGLADDALRTTAEERMKWLRERGLTRDYFGHLEQRLQRRVRGLVEETTPAAESVMVGVLDYEPHWTGDALVNGILEARGSVLVLARAPCGCGYTMETDLFVDRMIRRKGTVVCVPGVSPSEVGADRLPLELFHLAMNSAGYWISSGRQVREGKASREPFGNPTRELLLNCGPANAEIAKWVGGSE